MGLLEFDDFLGDGVRHTAGSRALTDFGLKALLALLPVDLGPLVDRV